MQKKKVKSQPSKWGDRMARTPMGLDEAYGYGDFYVSSKNGAGPGPSYSSRMGIKPGSEDVEKSRFIDNVIQRLNS